MKVFNLYFLILILSAGLNNLAQDWRKMSEEEINAFLRRIYGDRYSWFDKDYQDEEYELDALESAAKLLNDYEAKLTENVAASKPKKNKHRNKRKVVRVDKDEEDLDNAIILAEKERLLIDDEVNAEITSLKEEEQKSRAMFWVFLNKLDKNKLAMQEYQKLALDDKSKGVLALLGQARVLAEASVLKNDYYLDKFKEFDDLEDLKIKKAFISKFEATLDVLLRCIDYYKTFFKDYAILDEAEKIKRLDKCIHLNAETVKKIGRDVPQLWKKMIQQLLKRHSDNEKLLCYMEEFRLVN